MSPEHARTGSDAAALRLRKPGRLLQLLYRLPVSVYRKGLGLMLGGRFLLLTHRGRKTGRIYQTVLEVLRHDETTGEYIVVSAYGDKADWYRNIRASPALEVQVGRHQFVPDQRFLTEEEGYGELLCYERRYPVISLILMRVVGLKYHGTESERRSLAAFFRFVSFRPRGSGSSSEPKEQQREER